MNTAVKGALVPAALLICWELASRAKIIQSETFSRPSDAIAAGYAAMLDGSLPLATAQTLQSVAVGIFLAILIGVPLGVLIGMSVRARWAIAPTLDVLQPLPPVAIIPLALLIFGFGLALEASVIAFASIWPIMIATTAAVRSLEKKLTEVAQVLQLSTFSYVRKIVIPATLPRIAVGVRVALGIAMVVAVTVEIVANPRGLGHGMVEAQQSLRPGLVYAQLFWIGAVGWFLNWVLLKLDTHFFGRFSNARARR